MTIALPTDLTVARAPEIVALLLEALERHEALELSAREVREVDLAGLQILCAARRSAAARGRRLTFPDAARSDVVRKAMAVAGLRWEEQPDLAEVRHG